MTFDEAKALVKAQIEASGLKQEWISEKEVDEVARLVVIDEAARISTMCLKSYGPTRRAECEYPKRVMGTMYARRPRA